MQPKIILYTTHCPKCNVLKQKLDEKNISYIEIDDVPQMQALDILSVPVLSVDEELLNFGSAIAYIGQKGDIS